MGWPMVDVPALGPTTNRRAATAHDICMRDARGRREITRDGHVTQDVSPTAPGVRHRPPTWPITITEAPMPFLAIDAASDYFYRLTTTAASISDEEAPFLVVVHHCKFTLMPSPITRNRSMQYWWRRYSMFFV